MTRQPTVAILGCGPAGLFAAHAAVLGGANVTVFSKARKSYMRGAQYLHRPIPGLSRNPFQVEYKLRGSVEGYRKKVYGDMDDILVSPQSLVGVADAWDIREAYDAAWSLYGDRVTSVDFSTMGAKEPFMQSLVSNWDLVISTIPAPVLCSFPSLHSFTGQKVWVTENLKSLGDFHYGSDNLLSDDLVVCSGDPDDWWYRQSRIQGWENTEFPHDQKPNFPGLVHEVTKPLTTDCTCHPGIIRAGRYGMWQKGVLSHEAYDKTAAIVKKGF
jgi:hypothetical protein